MRAAPGTSVRMSSLGWVTANTPQNTVGHTLLTTQMHRHAVDPVHDRALAEVQGLLRDREADVREALQQRREGDPQLQAGELGADAAVDAVPEGHVPGGRPAGVEPLRV